MVGMKDFKDGFASDKVEGEIDLTKTMEAMENLLYRYEGATKKMYAADLKIWIKWCVDNQFDPMKIRRRHLEAFTKYMILEKKNSPRSASRRLQTVKTFYKLASVDELIPYDPTVLMKMPKWEIDKDSIASLDRQEVSKLLKVAKETSPAQHALVAFMAMLGLRVSEVCSIDIEDFERDRAEYVIVKVRRKGNRITKHPVPMPLFDITKAAKGDRESGPLIITRAGNRQNRNGAYNWVKALLKKAELNEKAHPHTLRHAAITALIDSGEPIHKVQEFADHKDIRMTEHYYRRSENTATHAAHVTARLFSY